MQKLIRITDVVLPLAAFSVFLLQALVLGEGAAGDSLGPRWWPVLIAGFGIFLTLLLLGQHIIIRSAHPSTSAEGGLSGRGLLSLGVVLIATAIAIVLWQMTTYLLAFPLYIWFVITFLSPAAKIKAIPIAAVITAIIYFVFDFLLKVPL